LAKSANDGRAYQVAVQTINEHVLNIYNDRELFPEATIRKFRIVQTEGSRQIERLIDFYNLDIILAFGYRVRSNRGAQFRRWATERLREFLVKGFVLDDERLKEGRSTGADYFDELLERVRDIRASEKRFYQKVRDIYDFPSITILKQKAPKNSFRSCRIRYIGLLQAILPRNS
jgi:hypothetical protein